MGFMPLKAFADTPSQARVIVSLADNQNQGIVPIKASLGDGQSPRTNLYWGALYGAKTHFKRMEGWSLSSWDSGNANVLDSFALQHSSHPKTKILFEAWDGTKQKSAVQAYFEDLGNIDSSNDLVCFVGHNALMDFSITKRSTSPTTKAANIDRGRKGTVIACRSAPYFESHHDGLGVESYVMTKGLMAPEAYVLEGFLAAWLKGDTANKARANAAAQYAKYQKIPLRNANWLFGVKA